MTTKTTRRGRVPYSEGNIILRLSSVKARDKGKAEFALVFSEAGRWKEIEELQVQLMETRKRMLGEEHPSTFCRVGNISEYTASTEARSSLIEQHILRYNCKAAKYHGMHFCCKVRRLELAICFTCSTQYCCRLHTLDMQFGVRAFQPFSPCRSHFFQILVHPSLSSCPRVIQSFPSP